MLTSSISQTISVELSIGIDDVQTFQVTAYSDSDSITLPSTVTITDGTNTILSGKATAYSYDYHTHIITISGQDTNSHTKSQDNHESELSASTSTHIQEAINNHTANAVTSANPNLPCYGYGSYNGDTHSLIERVCNSFGMNYYSTPVGSGYTLTDGDINTPSWSGCTQFLALNLSNKKDSNRAISTIYCQKAVTQSGAVYYDIENAGHTTSTTIPLCNPNAQESGYPADVWIDPWTRCLVNILAPVTVSIFDRATSIGDVKKIEVISCTDSQAQPSWYLEIWDSNPGTIDAPSTTATKLATVQVGHTWTASGSDIAKYVRIARTLIYEPSATQTSLQEQTAIDYPHYEGVSMGVNCYADGNENDVEAWSDEFNSGDTGRVDHNVISEEMYPDYSTFNSNSMGQRIARRDSIVFDKVLRVPNHPSITPKQGTGVQVEGIQHPVPACRWIYNNAPGISQTDIEGEW